MREDRLGTAQADLRRARGTGRTGSVEVDVVGGITGPMLGVLVTNVFVTNARLWAPGMLEGRRTHAARTGSFSRQRELDATAPAPKARFSKREINAALDAVVKAARDRSLPFVAAHDNPSQRG